MGPFWGAPDGTQIHWHVLSEDILIFSTCTDTRQNIPPK